MSSYKDLALYDMKSASANYEYELWNKVGRECHQACEKYLKHYLYTNHLLAGDLEKTHNLKKLVRAIPNYSNDVYKAVSLIGDYYFDTNYPGDNFILLDRDMANEAIETAHILISYIDSLNP